MPVVKSRIRPATPAKITGSRVTAISLSKHTARLDTSRQVVPNRKEGVFLEGHSAPLATPYSTDTLLELYEISNILQPCIEAYVTNVASYGWAIVPFAEGVAVDEKERELLQSFIDSPNYDESLTSIISSIVRFRERIGYSFLEVIRNRKGEISVLRNVDSPGSVGILPRSNTSIPVTYDIVRGPRTSNVTELRKFRAYVQEEGGRKVYFKEFGDPRSMNCETGEYANGTTRFSPELEATELIHFRISSDDPYGVPRWLGQLPSVLGSRESEEVNYNYFRENTIPPMMLTVSGGRLTGESFRELRKLLNEQALGKARQHKVILLEAVPERESLDDKGNVSIRLDKLMDARQSDGLFSLYDEANRSKVRSSFRLPPVAVGLSQDVTFATAQVSAFLAEVQVYHPERSYYAERFNKTIVNSSSGLNLKTVSLALKAPPIVNPDMRVKTLTASNVMGAITPRIAAEFLNETMPNTHPGFPERGTEGYEEWMDRPIAISLRMAAGRDIGNLDVEGASKPDNSLDSSEDGDVSMRSPENGQQ